MYIDTQTDVGAICDVHNFLTKEIGYSEHYRKFNANTFNGNNDEYMKNICKL